VCNHAAPDVHWHFAVTHTREIARGDVGVGVGPMSSNLKCRWFQIGRSLTNTAMDFTRLRSRFTNRHVQTPHAVHPTSVVMITLIEDHEPSNRTRLRQRDTALRPIHLASQYGRRSRQIVPSRSPSQPHRIDHAMDRRHCQPRLPLPDMSPPLLHDATAAVPAGGSAQLRRYPLRERASGGVWRGLAVRHGAERTHDAEPYRVAGGGLPGLGLLARGGP